MALAWSGLDVGTSPLTGVLFRRIISKPQTIEARVTKLQELAG